MARHWSGSHPARAASASVAVLTWVIEAPCGAPRCSRQQPRNRTIRGGNHDTRNAATKTRDRLIALGLALAAAGSAPAQTGKEVELEARIQ
jgi:hypothetical protein